MLGVGGFVWGGSEFGAVFQKNCDFSIFFDVFLYFSIALSKIGDMLIRSFRTLV